MVSPEFRRSRQQKMPLEEQPMKLSTLMARSAVAGLVLGLTVSVWHTTTSEPLSQVQETQGQLKAGEHVHMCVAMKEKASYYNCLCTSCNTHFVASSVPEECPYCGSGNVTCRSRE